MIIDKKKGSHKLSWIKGDSHNKYTKINCRINCCIPLVDTE